VGTCQSKIEAEVTASELRLGIRCSTQGDRSRA
jgi:hypothetical protein